MEKKNLLIIGFASLALVGAVGFGHQFRSNQILKDQINQSQDEADTRISDLEEKLDRLKKGEIEAKPATEFLSEEDLLANFFEVAPKPVEINTESEVANDSKVIAGPSLLVTPEVFDLGQISKSDGVAIATFDLKNNGSKPLTISYAFSSCGCTVAPLKEEKVLEPGETFPLEVSYDPNFYGPKYELGPIEKTVTILSNYSARPFYKVKLKANVTP